MRALIFISDETHTCPDGFTRFNGRCFKFNAQPKTYNEAVDVCEKTGGTLPVIESDDENRFVACKQTLERL